MKQHIFLLIDDVRNPLDVFSYTKIKLYDVTQYSTEWNIVRSHEEFCKFIETMWNETKDLPDFISFDHDLADEHYRPSMYDPDEHYSNYYTDGTFKEKTGYSSAVWLVEFLYQRRLALPIYYCHSMNPIGKQNILAVLQNYEKNCVY